MYNLLLVVAACLSAFAALLHLGIIVGGGPWYRFFGAGERLASAAEAGRCYPAMITAGIAAVLLIWAAYALSGAGVIAPLPVLKMVLAAITGIYLLRGLAALPVFVFSPTKMTPFIGWSSLVCTLFGVIHLAGLIQVWSTL